MVHTNTGDIPGSMVEMQSLGPPGWAEAEPKCEEIALENERKIQEETPTGFDPHLKIYRQFLFLLFLGHVSH